MFFEVSESVSYLREKSESVLESRVFPVVVWVWRIDHDEQELLEERRPPHHSSLLDQLCVDIRVVGGWFHCLLFIT